MLRAPQFRRVKKICPQLLRILRNTAPRGADWQSAVSPNGIRQNDRMSGAPETLKTFEWKLASSFDQLKTRREL
jgi:hypothetical protein